MAVTIDGTGVVSVDGTSTTQGRVRLYEDTDNGTNYVELQAPATLASNQVLTLPDATGTILTSASTVTVSQGGTGATTLTSNNVILGNGTSAVQFVAPGTNGNVLTSNGTTWASSAAPTPTAAQGASLVYITSVTANNSATVDVESSYDSTYAMYMIIAEGVYCSSNIRDLQAYLKIGGSYISAASSYRIAVDGMDSTAVTRDANASNTAASIQLSPTNNLSSASSTTMNMVAYIPNPSSTAQYKTLYGHTFGGNGDNDGFFTTFIGFARGAATSALTGVRFFASVGNLYGTFRLYGIKNS